MIQKHNRQRALLRLINIDRVNVHNLFTLYNYEYYKSDSMDHCKKYLIVIPMTIRNDLIGEVFLISRNFCTEFCFLRAYSLYIC